MASSRRAALRTGGRRVTNEESPRGMLDVCSDCELASWGLVTMCKKQTKRMSVTERET